MVNYNLNMEDDDKFVCYYERGIMYTKDDNDKICSSDVLVLHMGDEGIVYIPNTRDNEVVVLNKIRSQMLKYKDEIGEIKKTLLDAEIVKYGSFFSMSASLMYALTRFKEGQIILGLILVIFAYLSHNVWRYYANSISYAYNCLDDYDKCMFYLDNEDLFKGIDYSDTNVFKGISDYQKNYIMHLESKINENSIEKLSLKELKKIKNNVCR